jgi:catechol 2,3-dioxygenase-like lactoylglutathione lyase family enzyme
MHTDDRMKTLSRLLTLVVVFISIGSRPAAAQLATPGPAGIAMGHVHLIARDLEAQHQFWSALGGVPKRNGGLDMVQFPGVFIILKQGEPSGGSVGSSVNHIGFNVRNVAEWVTKWQAAGLKMEPQRRPNQVYLIGPDDVRVEILEEPMQAEPIKMHHVHFAMADPLVAQAWYAKTFGAVPGKRAQFDAADLPGVNLTFGKDDTTIAKTGGRSIDHIGFEVTGIDAFVRKLKAMGITLDRAVQKAAANRAISTAFLTDPWGTQIELTENLSQAAR